MFKANEDFAIESDNKLCEVAASVLSFTSVDTSVNIEPLSQVIDAIDGDQVLIKYIQNCDAEFRDFYICEENSTVANNTLCKCEKHFALTKLIQEWKLGIAGVAKIYLIYKWLQCYFKEIDQLAVDICVTLINCILETSRSLILTNTHGSNTDLSFFELKRVSECRFVHIKSTEYEDFPHWSFGVHPSKNNEFLIGYLYMHKLYGALMLKDSNYKILCLITNQSELLEKVINCFILINKFYVVTEIFKDSSVYNLECILLDSKDIKILRHTNCENIQTYFNKKENVNPEHYIRFQLKYWSVTMLSETNAPEIWLLMCVVDCDDVTIRENLLLCISYKDIAQVLPQLMEEWYYKLLYDGTLSVVSNKELKRFYPDYTQMSLCSQNFAFIIEKAPQEGKQMMNVLQCKNFIATFPQGLVSFQGKIKLKRFANPISSRSLRECTVHGFGTSGPQTHYLEFAVEGSDVKTLKVYINNWESNLTQFGLVPGIICAVKNVSHQKGKYCKATPLTSFKIIRYEPDVEFTTVNLFTGDCADWGTPFYFSLGHKIPYGVLVWSKVYSLRIRSLKIINKCATCKSKVEALKCQCSDASTSVLEPYFWITLFVEDMYGSARIISSCKDLLQLIFNLAPHEWEMWNRAFQCIDKYEYNTESLDIHPEKVLLSKVLTNAVKVVNFVGVSNIELCCRKIDSNGDAKRNDESPVWYCIRARITESSN